ncbi:MAG: glycosyltransferase family 2 protein [Planctomycetia bacterium]|nr:glycosyltransferase family 2 protein [Planctomycetia bacterium]
MRPCGPALGDTICCDLGFYAVPTDQLLSVVIPVYNEERSPRELVDSVCAVPLRKEIVLVDDCTTNGSAGILVEIQRQRADDAENRVIVERHAVNRGNGAALRTGFARTSSDIIVVQDAELEYDPAEYPRILRPIVKGLADVAYGSRFLGHRPHRVLYYWHYVGNRLLTCLSNCFTNLNLTDMETGCKMFTRQVLATVAPGLRQNCFGFEPEITAKIARRGFRVHETSISYSGRTYSEGKKIGWRDGLAAVWCIVRYGVAD